MKLLSLTLRNFKGQSILTIAPEGADLSIYGDNAAGKTTIADAYSWLLFDKDSLGRSDFEIKPIGPDGEPMHRGEHEVSGEFEVDGRRIGLRKVYAERWETRRGGTTDHFAGHTTSYWVSGVPVQKKEYDAQVASICPERLFRLLSDPTYFAVGLSWQERRTALIGICGDISDVDVIASTPDLADLSVILEGRDAESHKKIAAEAVKRLSAEIKQIPARIDELSRQVADAPKRVEIEPLRQAVADAMAKKQAISAGGRNAEIAAQIREAEAEYLQREQESRAEHSVGLSGLLQLASKATDALRAAQRDLEDRKASLKRTESAVSDLDIRLARLRADYKDAADMQFPAGLEECPTCGQALPEDQVEEKRAAFNAKRAERLEQLTEGGTALRIERDELAKSLEDYQQRIDEMAALIDRLKADAESADAAVRDFPPLIFEAPELSAKIESLKASLASGTDTDAIRAADEAIVAAQQKLDAAAQSNAQADAADRAKARIEELTAEEKRLSSEHDRWQRELYLIEEFGRAKARLLTDLINNRFELVSFRLFEEQVNGGIKEVCDVTVDGVPYGSLNHGSRLNAGLDIIDAFAKDADFAPPVILDNSESVTRIRKTLGQQIRLVVSAKDRTLRFESAREQESLI